MPSKFICTFVATAFLTPLIGVTGVAAGPCAPGFTSCGSMGPQGPAKPMPVGPSTYTYPTNHPPKTVVYNAPPAKPLPRSAEAIAGRKAYCGKNPNKCGE